ncbi:MAG: hypothetical protein IAE83_07450 [Anaerolinea sp.]|nr:hypothetical protein [Anaerolinea sp.]CAG0985453.1 hypothetical protein ANRL4_02142 [Anaerolineae bacterium]
MITSITTKTRLSRLAGLLLMTLTVLACSGVDDLIGQRPARPTPTSASFATATPGGRVSVLLSTDDASNRATPTPFGEIVAPAATATALFGTLAAATATAGATPVLPLFSPDYCPNPSSPPPPDQPTAYSVYPETIGRYLSVGGAPVLLEGFLREWGAVRAGSVVQADTDLTGDGVPEVVITLYDPSLFVEGRPSPGQILVYGCAQGGYRLLYNTVYSPSAILPELRRVGDMNGDTRAELVYDQLVCTAVGCDQTVQVLSWSAALGVFKPLNEVPINASGGKIGIVDADADGVLEISVTFDPAMTTTSGPTRRAIDYWDWDGVSYRLAVTEVSPPVYRIHALHDADMLFAAADWEGAHLLYNQVRDGTKVQAWSLVPTEPIMLRAYAIWKKLLAYIMDGQRRSANTMLETLRKENPPGTPGEGYTLIAEAFINNYARTRDEVRACSAAKTAAGTRPETLIALNSYGYANRTYSLEDLCPLK